MGQAALALKDQVIKAKEDQLAQLQQLKDETIRAKDVQVEQLRGLTTPQLVEHIKGLGEIYDGALSNVRKQLHEKDDALRLGNSTRSNANNLSKN